MKSAEAYNKFALISGIIMVFVYCSVGILLFATDLFLTQIPHSSRQIFGVLIFGYGVYRGFTAYKKYSAIKNEKDSEL